MDVRVLGSIEVDVDERRCALGGPTQLRVLAALVARRGEVVDVSALEEACWPDGDAPDRASHNIRTYIHRLRGALRDEGERIETVGSGYRMTLAVTEVDLDRLAELAATAERAMTTGDAVLAADSAAAATGQWRGAPFGEFGGDAWALAETARATELFVRASETKADALLALGRADDAIAVLDGLIADQPLRERPRSLLMRALYEAGRQPEALRAFQDFRALLVDQVGVEPSPDLIDLDRRIATRSLDAPTSDRSVGAYDLHERIGEGVFAVVHRATQRALGRQVAIKAVRAELANQPEFILRFDAEAQMVAAIEHPNVVPLYDYWREPDQAFLVMRWMTGGSLETRLDDGPLELEAALELVDQIAAALDGAHAHDVVHRDVKPANILFDDRGHAFLGDFGIALAADERSTPEAALSEGSPVFASPEQLRREPAGPEADVHALGIVAFAALTGRTPFADAADGAELLRLQLDEPIPSVSTLRPELPPGIDEAIAVATAKRVGDRYPTAGAFARALRGGADTTPEPLIATEPRANPYRGLRAFNETDASRFHGRARLIERLLDECGDPARRLLSVVGPSGSGKSSVVRAGLVPALRAGRVHGSDRWFVTTMIPGTHPFEALETALLRVASNPPAALLDQLRDGDRGIHRAVSRIVPTEGGTVLVVIDQFEELFTLADEDGANRFLTALAVATSEPGGALRVVTTMRADFYGRPLRHPDFAPLFTDSTVAITPLAPDELETAITAPAAAVGVGFEPGLVAEIVADVNSQPGALPMLQYALTQTFDAIDVNGGDTMTLDAYRSIGGLTGALARRAESLFTDADPDEASAIRALMQRLVTLGEGSEDTRRRILRTELAAGAATDRAIDRYGAARLLTFDHDPASREPTIEIAHEALIREWPRLRRWLDDDRDTLRAHRHLTGATAAWLASDRDHGELYRGTRLASAEPLLDHRDLNTDERAFLAASIERRDAEARQEARRIQRLRRLVAAVATIAVIALAAGAIALVQWNQASDSRLAAQNAARDADLERMISLARTSNRADPSIGLLVAIEAHRIGRDTTDASAEKRIATLDALHHALTARDGFLGSLATSEVGDITVLDDGDRIATHTADQIEIWNVATRERLSWPFPDPGGLRTDVVLLGGTASTDGRYFAAAEPTGVTVVDLASGESVHRFDRPSFVSRHLAFSPDGLKLAAGFDARVEVWALGDEPTNLGTTDRPAPISDLSWSPDGSALAIGTWDSSVALWDHRDPTPVWERPSVAPPSSSNLASGLLFSGDGTQLIVSAQTDPDASATGRRTGDRTMQLLDARTGLELASVTDQSVRTSAAWLDGDESRLVSTPIWGGEVTVFEVAEGAIRAVGPLGDDKEGPSPGIGVLPSLDLVVTGGANGLELRSRSGGGPLSTLAPLSEAQRAANTPLSVHEAAFDDAGIKLVTSVIESGVEPTVVDLERPIGVPRTTSEEFDMSGFKAVQRSGEFSVWIADDDSFTVRRGLLGEPVGVPIAPQGDASSAELSPTGDRLMLTIGGRATLFDTSSGDVLTTLDPAVPFTPFLINAQFSPDGSIVTVWDYFSQAAGFDATTGDLLWSSAEFRLAAPARSNDRVLTVGGFSDSELTVRSAEPPFPIVGEPLVGHQSGTAWMRRHPERNWLATEGRDGTTRVWDLATRTQIGRALIKPQASGSRWSPDGSLLAVPSPEGYVIWNYDTDTWPEIACEVAGRNLTRAEWDEFGPRNTEYRATCEQYPIEP